MILRSKNVWIAQEITTFITERGVTTTRPQQNTPQTLPTERSMNGPGAHPAQRAAGTCRCVSTATFTLRTAPVALEATAQPGQPPRVRQLGETQGTAEKSGPWEKPLRHDGEVNVLPAAPPDVMHRLNHGTYKTHNHLVQEPLLCNRHHTGLTDMSNNRICGTTTGKEQPVASAQQGHRPPWKNNWGVSPGQRGTASAPQ